MSEVPGRLVNSDINLLLPPISPSPGAFSCMSHLRSEKKKKNGRERREIKRQVGKGKGREKGRCCSRPSVGSLLGT